jgi:hypothetical protein
MEFPGTSQLLVAIAALLLAPVGDGAGGGSGSGRGARDAGGAGLMGLNCGAAWVQRCEGRGVCGEGRAIVDGGGTMGWVGGATGLRQGGGGGGGGGKFKVSAADISMQGQGDCAGWACCCGRSCGDGCCQRLRGGGKGKAKTGQKTRIQHLDGVIKRMRLSGKMVEHDKRVAKRKEREQRVAEQMKEDHVKDWEEVQKDRDEDYVSSSSVHSQEDANAPLIPDEEGIEEQQRRFLGRDGVEEDGQDDPTRTAQRQAEKEARKRRQAEEAKSEGKKGPSFTEQRQKALSRLLGRGDGDDDGDDEDDDVVGPGALEKLSRDQEVGREQVRDYPTTLIASHTHSLSLSLSPSPSLSLSPSPSLSLSLSLFLSISISLAPMISTIAPPLPAHIFLWLVDRK